MLLPKVVLCCRHGEFWMCAKEVGSIALKGEPSPLLDSDP